MMRTTLISLFLLAPTLLFGAVSIADVSGTLSHGESVIITGSGFGSKSTAAPAIWDDCETGTIGSKWTVLLPNAADDSNNDMQYRTTYRDVAQAHSNSTKYATGCHAESGYTNWRNNAGPSVMLGTQIPAGARNPEYFYASWYYRGDPLWPDTNNNYKQFRVTNEADMLGCDGGGFYLEYNPVPSGDSSMRWHGMYMNPTDNATIVANSPRAAWRKMEVTCHMVNGSTGYVRLYENGTLKFEIASDSELEFTAGTNFQYVAYGEYWRKTQSPETGDDDAWRYFDDMYFDSTLQRVIVGNADTLEGCTTLREIQAPSAWSDTSITITFNQGGFVDSATAYLYVFDSTGEANATGYEVTIGEGSSPSTPSLHGVSLNRVNMR